MMAGKHLEQMQEMGQRSHQQLRQRRNVNVDGRATTVEALIRQPGWWALKAPNFSRATLQNTAQTLGRCQMGLGLRQKRFHYHQSGNVLRRNTEGEKAQTPLPI